MTLVNKTLAGIPDQDTYYDFVDRLEESGMESIAEKYSQLDAQLREQFKLYEQALEAEDGDDDDENNNNNNNNNNSNNDDSENDKTPTNGTSVVHTNNIMTTTNNKIVANDNDSYLNNHVDDSVVIAGGSSQTSSTLSEPHQRRKSKRAERGSEKQASVMDNTNNNQQQVHQGRSDTLAAGVATEPPHQGQHLVDCDESGETTNDDNYESANESNGSLSRRTAITPTTEKNKSVAPEQRTPVSDSKQGATLRQQLPRQHMSSTSTTQASNSIKQNNLARGKQQRASISSCSSSDSYASYGSGYASGSGNSTDHEHKQQKSLTSSNATDNENASTATNKSDSSNANTSLNHQVDSARRVDEATKRNIITDDNVNDDPEEDDDDDNDHDDDDDDDEAGADNESQLKQHLSELEQLTDELAKRNIFCTISKPGQHSSTIKSNSSNSSSVLSTGSNISSLSNDNTAGKRQHSTIAPPVARIITQQQLNNQHNSTTKSSTLSQPLSSLPNDHNESRSTSATPTSCVQPISPNIKQTPTTYMQNHSTSRQAVNEEMSTQTKLMGKTHPYTMSPSSTSSLPAQTLNQLKPSASQSKQQQQPEPYYHNLFQWEQLVSRGVTRPLLINDLDFTDLRDEDDHDLLNGGSSSIGQTSRGRNQATGEPLTISIPEAQQHAQGSLNMERDSTDSGTSTGSPGSRLINPGTPASAPPPLPPPPISPWFNTISGSRPQSQFMSTPSPPPFEYSNGTSASSQQQSSNEFNRDESPANSTYSNYSRNSVCVTQMNNNTSSPLNTHYNTLQPVSNLRSASSMSSLLFGNRYGVKRKKTMKLFWKEVREDRSLLSKLTKKKTIWDEIKPVHIDTTKLEYLFESKAKDLMLSKSRNGLDGASQRKVKITVLDAKRSNAINIGMTKLPPMRTIKSAILKMDSSIMNREGIEKILTTMMPSEEEKSRIIEAQLANPDTPLGTAEQFLLNLASISALEARLKLWAFQLDYAQIEKEVAEPLMDLKQAIEEIEHSETFRIILGTLLAIGNFLNSTNAKGFQIDYLEKIPEVKDTVHKHSLLHHLCLFIQEKFDPQLTSDLYSEFSAVNRASKVDYSEVAKNLKKMQQDCKASWDYLKIVAKHDGLANLMNTCGSSSSSSSNDNNSMPNSQPKSSGKLNNLSKLSMITTVISSDNNSTSSNEQQSPTTKQLKTKVSDFLTDCAERIMVLMVIHRRVMNRFQKLLVYLGCPSSQIKQTQPQQILKIINEFALEYRTKRERVKEMLMKKQQCQNHNHNANRWQLSRLRWAGSQQYIDSLGYNQMNRPCSTASSCASSAMVCTECTLDSRHHNNQQNPPEGSYISGNRASSPSGLSQISNYSDYLFDQSCCTSRQESITPVPSGKGLSSRRPHSMSVSMFDLQNQQHQNHHHQQQQNYRDVNITSLTGSNVNNSSLLNASNSEEDESARQKDEQLRRLLGAGKSLDGACNDLYQMSHWSSTMARVSRHPPIMSNKQRAASIDSSTKEADDSLDSSGGCVDGSRRQSSYYRYLHNGGCMMDDESGQNSDEEILQSLVRTATPKSGHNGSHGNRSTGIHSSANKGAKSKILSRFSCDRKSLRRTLGPGIEMSNA